MPLRPTLTIFALTLCFSQLPACQTGQGSGKAQPPPALSADKAKQAEEWKDKGQSLMKDGFTDKALAAFNNAIEQNPKLTAAHLGIGDIYRGKAVFDKAKTAYRKAVVSDPNNFDARYYLGLTNQLEGKIERAIASYQRALRIKPTSYLANRDMGSAYLQTGQPDKALPYAKAAVKANPESQPGWANLAAAYSLTGDYKQAVLAYRQTLELGKPGTPILLGLAEAHIKLGNYQRAENVLRAIERAGGDVIASERMGLVLFKQRKFEEAAEAYAKALKQDPKDTAALNGRGVSLMAIYLRDKASDDKVRLEALGLWRQSLSIDPKQVMLIDLIARYTKE